MLPYQQTLQEIKNALDQNPAMAALVKYHLISKEIEYVEYTEITKNQASSVFCNSDSAALPGLSAGPDADVPHEAGS